MLHVVIVRLGPENEVTNQRSEDRGQKTAAYVPRPRDYDEPRRYRSKRTTPRFMLRCALLSVSVGTAFRILRDPAVLSARERGRPILIAGCSDTLRDRLGKKRLRSG